jgi:hypothetical protein
MTGDPWSNPTGGSGIFSPSDHVGALVLIAVRAFHPQLQGSFGARDAVEVGLDIVTEQRNPSLNGQRFESVLLYGVALVDELKDKIGQHVLGRLMAKPTKNPSPVIVLEPASDYEAQAAREHWQRVGPMDLTPKPTEEVQQVNAQHAQAFAQQQNGQQQPVQQVGQPAPWQSPQTPPPGPPPPTQQPVYQQPVQQPQQQPAYQPPQPQNPPF